MCLSPVFSCAIAEKMNLNELNVGGRCRIVSVGEGHPVCQRLMSFGLLPGQEIELRRVAPLNDPIVICFNGQQISLRRSEAVHVEIEPAGALASFVAS